MATAPDRSSWLGEARGLLPVVGPTLVLAVVATLLVPDRVAFLGPFVGAGRAAGLLLASVGVAFWLASAIALVAALRSGRFTRTGAFALVRHPIFAWWIWFVLPSVALIVDSWPFLIAAAVFFAASLPAARREDEQLVERFAAEADAYRREVRALVPVPRLRGLSLRRVASWAAAGSIAVVSASIGFALLVRPIMLSFGTEPELRAAVMAGDELIREPRSRYTQSIVIDAAPSEIWPWLIQVGAGRAGWYNVDAINRLASPDYFYEGGRSARRVIAELQDVARGDAIALAPGVEMIVVEIVPERRLLLAGVPDDPAAESNAVWLYELTPIDAGSTRVTVRFSSTFPGGVGARLLNGFVNEIGGAIIQQPAMMHGLRVRAEGRLRS